MINRVCLQSLPNTIKLVEDIADNNEAFKELGHLLCLTLLISVTN